MANLPKTCPKCDGHLRDPDYVPERVIYKRRGWFSKAQSEIDKTIPEGLQWQCLTCGFEFETACKDATEEPAHDA